MKNLFTAEDFKCLETPPGPSAQNMAEIANNRLNVEAYLLPTVYSSPDSVGDLFEWSKGNYPGSTHQARLLFIEVLPKEPCKHQPSFSTNLGEEGFVGQCRLCGANIKAEWVTK